MNGIFGTFTNLIKGAPTSPEVEAAEKEKADLVAKQKTEKGELDAKHTKELEDADKKIEEARNNAKEDAQVEATKAAEAQPSPDGVQGGKRKHTKRAHKKRSKKGRTGRKSNRL
jgi:hypothetical protein